MKSPKSPNPACAHTLILRVGAYAHLASKFIDIPQPSPDLYIDPQCCLIQVDIIWKMLVSSSFLFLIPGFYFTIFDCAFEGIVIFFILVSIGEGKTGNGFIECITCSHISAQHRRVS
jgi:hypothetical protein